MSESKKIAVVTGGNRGLGLQTCRELGQKGIKVILTSRHPAKGQEAADKLRAEGLDVLDYQLTVTDAESSEKLADFLREEFGYIDILVNNAGIFPDQQFDSSIFTTDIKTIRQALDTNFFGSLLVARALIPLMKVNNYGRVVNVSSGMGALTDMNGGYPGYRVSKTALNALTRMLAAELSGTNILVNAVCPGWVRTDMGGSQAPRSVEEGADTIVWLATLPDGGPTGGFFRDRQPIPW